MKISCRSLTTTPLGNSRCLEQPNLFNTFPNWSKMMTRITCENQVKIRDGQCCKKLLHKNPKLGIDKGMEDMWCGYYNLALDHNNPSFVVDANTAGMLQNIRTKLPHKLTVLVVDLDLVCRRPEMIIWKTSLSSKYLTGNNTMCHRHNTLFLSEENMFFQEASKRIFCQVCLCAAMTLRLIRGRRSRYSESNSVFCQPTNQTNRLYFLLTLSPVHHRGHIVKSFNHLLKTTPITKLASHSIICKNCLPENRSNCHLKTKFTHENLSSQIAIYVVPTSLTSL